ncbi:prolyl oligopeptidase family serine peptidase [Tessaracoccus sp. OS52]|uniref:alpha/beta hydrolase family protein n=1 Tax=Tessaracoccus sp. OS52 TaxID=2886691 RepID=UPI001D113677|nr:prolyl oligopeptidase family serine peptidase [Tessaracoccus sp. OS52]MCC2592745.1 prolyl oligopeptidase family serine peptidase [Tessaracoccus sp. OS52]
MRTVTPHISLDDALTGTDQIRQVRATGSGIHWLASIAAEDKRTTIRRLRDGEVVDLTPGASVRSRVMEYGGGAYDAADDLVAYVDDLSRQLWLIDGEDHRPITPPQERYRYGGLHLAPHRRILVAVREDHAVSPEPRTEIVSLDLDGDNGDGGTVLVTGADFYAGPQVRGDELAWFQWMHPDMSWDSSEVMLGSLDDTQDLRVVAGGHGVSAQHPLWLGNALAWCSDESGYWNWYHGDGEQRTQLALERDCDIPTWVLDSPPACVVNDDLIATVEIGDGAGALTLWQPSTGGITRLLPGTSFVESISALGEDIYVIAAWPDRPETLVHISPGGTVAEVVGGAALPDPVAPEARWADGDAGAVQSWFYAPPAVENPPLLVRTHGGPTSASLSAYDREFQFWVSRGFAVLDVNYSGSTGFGRAYRDRLKGRWGLLDVSDVVAAVGEVTGSGLADPARVAIMGGSAGGYTTLQALVTTDVFAAGISSYGIADLRTLATDTHKAESHYTDSLVGPWPEAEQTYLERSPITQLEHLATPMLILQGLDDKVVPPNQAFDMAEAVRAKGQPLALITFDGEGHGFRSMAARRQALEAKVSFLQQVFGMEHSSDVPVLPIENLA